MMVTRRSSSSELRSPALTSADHQPPRLPRSLPGRFHNDAPLVQIDVCLLANDVGVSPANTLDLSQSVHNLAFSIDVGVQQTENVLMTMRVSPTPKVWTG